MLFATALSFIKLLMTFPIVISGGSMVPTFYNDDIVYAEMFDARFGEISRGDIVVFTLPYESKANGVGGGVVADGEAKGFLEFGDLYIKRVVGVSGDEVAFKNGKIFVNGEELKEPYIRKGTVTRGGEVAIVGNSGVELSPDGTGVVYKVPKNSYFLLGDNRESSVDSRNFTYPYVKRENIKGVFTYLKFP